MTETTAAEEWRTVSGYPLYEVSDQGRVRSYAAWRGRSIPHLLTPTRAGAYLAVRLGGDSAGTHVHRLVSLAFLGPCPDGMERRHLDGNPRNNRLANLRYGTSSENHRDAVEHGTHANAAKTHCAHDHPYDEENTYRGPDGKRGCRACNRRAVARYKARRKP